MNFDLSSSLDLMDQVDDPSPLYLDFNLNFNFNDDNDYQINVGHFDRKLSHQYAHPTYNTHYEIIQQPLNNPTPNGGFLDFADLMKSATQGHESTVAVEPISDEALLQYYYEENNGHVVPNDAQPLATVVPEHIIVRKPLQTKRSIKIKVAAHKITADSQDTKPIEMVTILSKRKQVLKVIALFEDDSDLTVGEVEPVTNDEPVKQESPIVSKPIMVSEIPPGTPFRPSKRLHQTKRLLPKARTRLLSTVEPKDENDFDACDRKCEPMLEDINEPRYFNKMECEWCQKCFKSTRSFNAHTSKCELKPVLRRKRNRSTSDENASD